MILTELEHASKHSNRAACIEGSEGDSWNRGETGMDWTTTEEEGCVTR